MKFDMHCHTKEGSMDGKVPIDDFIAELIRKGFDGMLVSDHNSYNGYRAWKRNIKEQKYKDFVVLKGIEYDTIDAGHILVIMPENVKLKILELRGLPVQILIDIVHKNGGILGPAHPCGEKYLSFTNTLKKRNQMAVMNQFDFLEGFNACESVESNHCAKVLAEMYALPTFGGSDAHKTDCIGMAYTDIPEQIHCASDLIRDVCIRHTDTVRFVSIASTEGRQCVHFRQYLGTMVALYTLTGIEAFQEIKPIHHRHLIPLLQGIGEA